MIGEEELREFIKDLDEISDPITRPALEIWEDYKNRLEQYFKEGKLPLIVYTGIAKYGDIKDFADKWNKKFREEYGQGLVYLEGRSILCKYVGRKPEHNESVYVKVVIFPVITVLVGLNYTDVRLTLEDIAPFIYEYCLKLTKRWSIC